MKYSIIPQLIVVGSPRPMKLSEASVRIAPDIENIANKNASGITFGAMCLNMILAELAPVIFADSIYGLSFRDKVSALMVLAIPGQPIAAIAITIFQTDGPNIEANMITKGRKGRVSTTSAILMRMLSTLPPLYPDISPRIVPILIEKKAAENPTSRAIFVPVIT